MIFLSAIEESIVHDVIIPFREFQKEKNNLVGFVFY